MGESDNFTRLHIQFAHGLVPPHPARGGPTIFGKRSTAKIATFEARRYREAIQSGLWVDAFTDADPFYAVMQTGDRGKGLVQEMSKQIQEPAAAVRFAELFARPNVSVGESVLSQFVDLNKLKYESRRVSVTVSAETRWSINRVLEIGTPSEEA